MARQIGRKSFLSFGSKIFINLFGLLSLIFVKRYLGYEAIGAIAFAASYVALFSIISDMGFGLTHMKRVNEKGSDEGICNGTLLTTKFALNLLMVGVIMASILTYKYVLDQDFESITVEVVLYLTVMKVFIDKLVMPFTNIFSAKLEIAKAVVPRVFIRFIQMSCKISILYMGFGVYHIIGIEIFAGLFLLFIALYLFKGYDLKKPNWRYFKNYSTFAFPVLLLGFIGTLTQNFDKVMIESFLGSESVGIYYLPEKIVFFVLLISVIVTRLLFPVFSEHYSKKNFAEISRLTNLAVKYTSMTLIPLVVCLFIFSEVLLNLLFGSDTARSVPVMKIMLLTLYLHVIINPYAVQLTSSGHLGLMGIISAIALLINVVLNVIFIPEKWFGISFFGMGVIGAAYATFISLTLRGILSKYFSYKLTKTKFYTGALKHGVAGIFSGFVVYNLNIHYAILYLLPIYFAIVLVLYLIVLYVLGEFGKDEYNFYMQFLSIEKMRTYISGELRN